MLTSWTLLIIEARLCSGTFECYMKNVLIELSDLFLYLQ